MLWTAQPSEFTWTCATASTAPRRFYNNGDFIGERFRKLGRWIVSCHAKDLQWITELNIHFQEVVPGRGQIDYRRYLTELNRLAADTPLMIEHLKSAI